MTAGDDRFYTPRKANTVYFLYVKVWIGLSPAITLTKSEGTISMKEHSIEQALRKAVDEIGGLCWKFTSPGTSGVPDRICIRAGRVVFVELKAPGQHPRPIQLHRIKQLQDRGGTVMVIDSIAGIEEVLDALQAA